MPDGCDKVPMSEILTYEQIVRICKAASALGIRKIKVTGGEPFVRRGCTGLMRELKAIEGIDEVTVTTNGQTLRRYMDELTDMKLDGINISLDTTHPDKFRYITGGGDLAKTLDAIDIAAASGIRTKVNCVLQKGFNDDEICGLSGMAFEKGIDVRFIELMPIGAGGSRLGISNAEVLDGLKEIWPDLEPDSSIHGNGPAVYYRRPGYLGGIGLISAIHGKFCSSCNRIRLTSTGDIKPCLCYEDGTNIKEYLEGSDDGLREVIAKAILKKPESHCFTDMDAGDPLRIGNPERRLMSQIGG